MHSLLCILERAVISRALVGAFVNSYSLARWSGPVSAAKLLTKGNLLLLPYNRKKGVKPVTTLVAFLYAVSAAGN